MNDRLIALAGALISVALVVGLLVPTPRQQVEPPSRPTAADRGELGLAGARAWLEARGVATESLRVRYHGLRELSGPASGNLIVIHLPRLRAARPDELEVLRQWLRAGNTAVVLAAIASRPRWLLEREEPVSEGLAQLELGLQRAPDEAQEERPGDRLGDRPGDPDEPIALSPRAPHPLTDGIDRLSAAPPGVRVERTGDAASPWLGLFGRRGHASIFWRDYGDGGILVSAHPGLFGNDPIREQDNARLLANLVAQRKTAGGGVIFDDFHMGLSQLYDAEAFFSDPRLHASLAFLAGFWLLYVAGHSNRLAPPRAESRPPSTRAFTEAVAGLLARRCDRAAVGRELLAHFFDEVRRRHGLPENGRPAWAALRDHPELAPERIDRLAAMARRLERGEPVHLQRLTREIAHLQENLR